MREPDAGGLMLSGSVDCTASAAPFSKILTAHPRYVDIGTVETDAARACLIVEKDASRRSIAERFWGQVIQQGQYHSLKDELARWSLQSVVIEQSKTDGRIEIARNHQAECALFLFPKGKTLYFHWDPVELYPYLDTADLLDIKAAIAMLELTERYREKTAFKNIFRLLERGRAVFDAGGFKIVRPPHIDTPEAVPLKEGADPVEAFNNLVRASVSRWPIDPEHVSAILSSGLDTTIVAHMLRERVAPHRLRSFGYQGLDMNRDGIKAMREEVVARLDLDDYYPPVEDNFGEAYSLTASTWWPEQTQTDFAERLLARRMEALGITLATTGIGGDEMGMLTDKERAALSQTPKGNPTGDVGEEHYGFSLISKEFASQMPVRGDLSWPDGYSAYSVPDMANGTSFIYLRQGIWFANPLAAAELHTFAHFLPAEWRHKRRLSRAALTRLGYSDYFTKQVPKEDFSPTIETILTKVDWERLFRKNSILCDMGLINRERLFDGVDIFRRTLNGNVGIKIMTALHMELSLQSVCKNNLTLSGVKATSF